MSLNVKEIICEWCNMPITEEDIKDGKVAYWNKEDGGQTILHEDCDKEKIMEQAQDYESYHN